jgi:Metallo-beta-lactamase superfamily
MLFMLFRACFLGMSTFLCTCRFANSLTYSKTLRIVRGRGNFHQFHSTSIETTSSIDFLGDTNRTVSMFPDAGKMKSMNLVELKVLLKTLGGSPGVLRKAEILALCDDLLRDRVVSIEKLNVREKSESKASIAGNNIAPAKKPIRALSPILPGPKSVEQFQLPTIKGDVNQIGSRIVKDLGDMYAAKSNASVLNEPSDYDSSDFQPERDSTPRRNSYQPVNSIREYHMGNTSGSMEFKNLTTGQHYWAYHPTGAMRDERILEGYQPESGTSVGGPGSGLGDMDVTFLGTASCVPSLTRGVSCLAFRYNSCVWLVDCGEGSQQQMQKSRIRPSKITKIFITHLHGDHSFGLPGVLCLIGQSTMAERDKEKALRGPIDWSKQRPGAEDEHILDIYGPEGTRDYLRAVIQLSYSKVVHPYRIHELKDVPNLYVRPPRTPPPLPQVQSSGLRFSIPALRYLAQSVYSQISQLAE